MADTKIIKSTTEASAVIITQPLQTSTNTTEPNQVLENPTTTAFHDNVADVITTQPLMNNLTDEEQNQKQKFSQFNPGPKPPENVQQQATDDCTWCCFACTDCACDCAEICVDCGPCCVECCNNSGDCCAGCCDGGSGDAGNIDGGDVAGCLECCGACLECCNDN